MSSDEKCNGSSKSTPEVAKQQLEKIFGSSEANQWCVLTPKDGIDSLDCAPSSSAAQYDRVIGCEDEVKEHLKKAFDKIFSSGAHVHNYWEEFSLNVTHRLGLTYRETKRMDSESYNEAKLKHNVLHPILKAVSKAACIIPNQFAGHSVITDYIIEDEVEMKDGTPGQKPSVDGVIQVSDKDDEVILALIPVEMKVEIDPQRDYAQIASYINKMSTADDIRECIMIGVIIDKIQFRLAFSVYSAKKIPLPIVHISPPIAWRSESLVSEESMLILACTFLTGQLKRLQYVDRKPHPFSVPVKTLNVLGNKLLESPHILYTVVRGSYSDKKKIYDQQKEIQELRKTIKTLKTKRKK